jgi:hypothetical protein
MPEPAKIRPDPLSTLRGMRFLGKTAMLLCTYYRLELYFLNLSELSDLCVNSRAGTGPGPSPQWGLGLLLHNPKAHACKGLVLGLSPQARPWARPPGQARLAKARARSVKPDPSPHFSGPLVNRTRDWDQCCFLGANHLATLVQVTFVCRW